MIDSIKSIMSESIDIKKKLLYDSDFAQSLENVVFEVIHSLQNGGKVLFCGNGGSAADAQHIAAELSGRFYTDRPPLFAEALSVNSSFVTAVANDYGFDAVFERMTEAMGRENDVLFGITTSGNSENVVRALRKAQEIGMVTVAMTGAGGGHVNEFSRYVLEVPSNDTPRIQECHILIGHIICEMVESKIFEEETQGGIVYAAPKN